MKHYYLLFISILVTSTTFSQAPRIIIDVPTQQKPWNTTEWNDGPAQFQFAIVSDRTGGHRPGVFMDGVNKLNLLQPEFVMSVGDLIEGYTQDTVRLNAEWREFTGFIDQLEMPFFYVPGNHDITNEVMEMKWQELFGVTYYHFIYKDVLFLCLNSEDNYRGAGRGTIDDAQYEYIKKVLEENEDVSWTLVFLHQPLWVQEDTKRWKDVEELLQERDHNVFAGHYHRYWKSTRNNGNYIALATTGGGSRLRGPAYGEFDHVVWVTMTGSGPILSNLLLEGIWDENVVTEDIVDLVRSRPFPMEIEPIYLDDRSPNELEVPIRVTNSSDYELVVNIQGETHPSVFYELEEAGLQLGPNNVIDTRLQMINFNQKDLTGIDPIVLDVEAAYQVPGSPAIVLRNGLKVQPLPRISLTKAPARIKVDGNLKEWKGDWIEVTRVEGKPFDYDGEEDCAIRFSTFYDEDYLYVAVDIRDEEIYTNETTAHWMQDVLILGLDARSERIAAANSGSGRGTEWISYLRTYGKANPVLDEENLPEGYMSSARTRADGMSVEIAFPISYLNEMQQAEWRTVRLGVGYYDYDSGGEERTVHFWYPAWNDMANIPGSGMLFKED